jgi:flavin-dependent dehydrogenase
MEFDFGCVTNGYGWVFPKHDHLNVGLYTNVPRSKISRQELNDYSKRICGIEPGGEVVGHHIGLGGWRYRPKSERVFLIGDAAGLVDPLLGEGIYFAIRSGQMAAAAIDQEIVGKDNALRTFSSSLKRLQKDLLCCHSTASKFYKQLDQGYSALTFPITRYALMRGFAMGLPFSAIKRTWWTFPFRKIPASEFRA